MIAVDLLEELGMRLGQVEMQLKNTPGLTHLGAHLETIRQELRQLLRPSVMLGCLASSSMPRRFDLAVASARSICESRAATVQGSASEFG